MIDEIYNYTQYHFREEEVLMSRIGFQELAEQKAMHCRITSQVEEFRNRIHSGKNIVSISITSELKSWFKQHILIEDKKYANLYLTKKQ